MRIGERKKNSQLHFRENMKLLFMEIWWSNYHGKTLLIWNILKS